jgi:hypothetical protein
LAVIEAILEFDPARLHDLILFSVEGASDPARRELALSGLMIAARRKSGAIEPRSIEFFNSQPPETKRLLLRFLLLDRHRDALRHVFQFLGSDPEPAEGQRRPPISRDLALQISNRDDTIEFLAAMPAVEPAATPPAQSPLLGPLTAPAAPERCVTPFCYAGPGADSSLLRPHPLRGAAARLQRPA